MASSTIICETQPWKNLRPHVEKIKKTHLRDLLSDADRCKSMILQVYLLFSLQLIQFVNCNACVHIDCDGITLDCSRQQATLYTVDKIFYFAEGWILYWRQSWCG